MSTALRLTGSHRSLRRIPDGIVALARPGAPLRLAQLAPDAAERAMLGASLRRGRAAGS